MTTASGVEKLDKETFRRDVFRELFLEPDYRLQAFRKRLQRDLRRVKSEVAALTRATAALEPVPQDHSDLAESAARVDSLEHEQMLIGRRIDRLEARSEALNAVCAFWEFASRPPRSGEDLDKEPSGPAYGKVIQFPGDYHGPN